ncbi:MAG: C4-dicarboxylate ABC transporter substrate-binding protein [Paracoccaceae bacterium]|nr:MAG: C4-dicarboxylate ABC transporter substrate-binding protein [Paracoccaceae bacterium]
MTAFFGRLAAGVTAALLAIAPAAEAKLGRITIGTNPQGTTYYVLGGGLAKLFSDKLGVTATAQPYAGSSVYLPLIHSGEVTMGLSSSLDTSLAFRGKPPYDGTGGLTKLRSLGRAWALPYAFVARGDSGLKRVSDLRGHKVAVEFRANAALAAANRAILAAAGLDPDRDVEAVTITGIPEGYKLVTEGVIAAAPTALGIPLALQAHSTLPGGIIMLALDGPNATTEFLNAQVPGLYILPTKPGDNNPGVDEPKNVAGFDVFYLVSADMDEDDAYTLIRTLYENYEQMQADYAVLRSSPRDLLARPTNTAPFHPGAVRFFREVGLWSAENEARDAALMRGE